MDKIKTKQGMSIVELLSAIAVMLLVSVVLVTGVRLGVKAYTKSVSMSEAQVLCSTLTTIVSDDLRYAGTVYPNSTADDGTTVLKLFVHGKGEGYYKSDDDGQVVFHRDTEGDAKLLGKGSYPYGLKAEVTVKLKDDNTFTAEVKVTSKSDNVLSQNTFEVKPVNGMKITETTGS